MASTIDVRATVLRRVERTFEEDERVALELRGKLSEAVRLIHLALGPRKVVLFGSLARGTFFADRSDVDFAVEGLGSEPPPALADSLRALLGRRVDLVDPEWCADFMQPGIARGEILWPREER